MKVYVIVDRHEGRLYGIYSTLEKAKSALLDDFKHETHRMLVYEYEVDNYFGNAESLVLDGIELPQAERKSEYDPFLELCKLLKAERLRGDSKDEH